jgi:hypothetical protein
MNKQQWLLAHLIQFLDSLYPFLLPLFTSFKRSEPLSRQLWLVMLIDRSYQG